jgi:hypothetical protein
MDNDAKVTRADLDETRASLSEKMEMLEQHVVHSVQGATHAVQQTVDTVKDAVHDTVESVKHTLDLPLQVKRNPWGMVGGSIALGYLGGYLLLRRGSERAQANGGSPPAPPGKPRISKRQSGVAKEHRSVDAASGQKPVQVVSRDPDDPGWLTGVNNHFGPEITKLKGLAIGTVLGVVRDLITESAPEQMKDQLAGVMDGITVKLGGDPIRGLVLKNGVCAKDKETERAASEIAEPLAAVRRQDQITVGTGGR